MSTLDSLVGLEAVVIKRHLQRLRSQGLAAVRRDYLDSVGRTDGTEVRELLERCWVEEWEARKAAQKGGAS